MKISQWKKNEKENRTAGIMIQVNRSEALALIQSLAEQMSTWNNNAGRLESFAQGDKGAVYVSISVNPTECDNNCPNAKKIREAEEKAFKEAYEERLKELEGV